MGCRKNEPEERPPERPRLIAQSIAIASEEIPVETIGSDSGMASSMFSEILRLLEGDRSLQ